MSEQPTTRRSTPAADRHIDTVRISLSRGIVEIPWTSRTALLDQIRNLDSAKPIIDAFEAVGVSRPVVLTREQKGLLVESIDFWGNQTDGGLRPSGRLVRVAQRASRRSPRRTGGTSVSAEQVAVIPQCEECRKVWLPSDDERWQARWIDDGPEEKLIFHCAECAEREFADD